MKKIFIKKAICVLVCLATVLALFLLAITVNSENSKVHILDAWLSFDIFTGSGDASVFIGDDFITKNLTDTVKLEDFEKLIFNATELDQSNYLLNQDGKLIKITLKEDFIKTLADGSYFFEAEFSSIVIPLKLFVVRQKIVLMDALFTFDPWKGEDAARVTLHPNTYSTKFEAELFLKLYYKNEEINPDFYSIIGFANTSTIILYEDYVKTLPAGVHYFTAEFMNAEIMLRLDIPAPDSLGDLDGDGFVTAADARLCLRASAELTVLSEEQKMMADVFGNGEISASAARKILRYSAELISSEEFLSMS